MSQNNTKNIIQDDHFDLFSLLLLLKQNRRSISRTIMFFFFAALLIALLSPKEYTASMVMVPQTTNPQSKIGNLSGLAALAGINLNALTPSEITPKIFPQIVTSPAFRIELMNTPIKFEDVDAPISFYQFYTTIKKPSLLLKYTIGLPKLIIKWLKGNKEQTENMTDIISMSEEQERINYLIDKKISIILNENDGTIAIIARMTEPLAAAQMVKVTEALLQRYIIDFKIEKAKSNYDFIEQRYTEAKMAFQQIQRKRAEFRDQNKNISTAQARIEDEWLSAEFTLAQNVYIELARQLEQSRIQLKEETPVFTIIKPVKVPLEKSKPKRLIIITTLIFIGILVSITQILFNYYRAKVLDKWEQKKSLYAKTPPNSHE